MVQYTDAYSNYCHQVVELVPNIDNLDHSSIVVIYPNELKNQPILNEFLGNLRSRLMKLMRESQYAEESERMVNCMPFESQKVKFREEAKMHQNNFYNIVDEMNKEIDPYQVIISEKIQQMLYGCHIDADYVVDLVKKEGIYG